MNYDGAISIDTKIHTENIGSQLATIEHEIEKTAEKINSILGEIGVFKNVDIPINEIKEFIQGFQEGLPEGFAQGLRETLEEADGLALKHEELKQKQRELGKEGEKSGNKLVNAFKRIAAVAAKAFSRISKGAKSAGDSVGIGLKKILGYAIGIKSVFALFSKLRGAVIDGLQNFAQYSKEYNSAMSGFVSATAQAKNALATALAPAIQAIMPLLTQFVGCVTRAANEISRFAAMIAGKSTWTRAKTQSIDYAKSLNKVSTAAKKASGALAGFDQINVLNKKNTLGVGDSVADMFEEVPLEEKCDGILGAVKRLLEQLTKKINKFFKTTNFKSAGKNLGQKLKSVIETATSFIKGIDWNSIGRSISDFISGIDWKGIAWDLSQFGVSLVDAITRFISGVEWEKVGQAIGDFISGIDWAGVTWSLLGLGKALLDAFIGLISGWWESDPFSAAIVSAFALAKLTGLVGALSTAVSRALGTGGISLPALGLKFAAVVIAFEGGKKLGEMIASALYEGEDWNLYQDVKKNGGILKYLFPDSQSIGESIIDIIKGIKMWGDDIVEAWKEIGVNVIQGFKDGILSGEIGQWALGGFANPFIDAIRGIFKINSPSKVMEEQGEYVMAGFKNGLDSDMQNVLGVFSDLKDRAVSIVQGLKDKLAGIWNGIIGGVETVANSVINGINKMIGALNGLKFDIPDWVPLIGGKNFGINIPEIPKVSLPRLADGAVFRGGSPYAAIVNDQPRGKTNIEAPLATIKQALVEALRENGGNGSGSPEVYVYIGNEQLDDYIVRSGRTAALRSGGV